MENENLYSAFRASARFRPGATALCMGERVLTYAQLDTRVRSLACALLRHGGPAMGEPVAVFAEKSLQWPVVSLALQALGAVEHPRELDQTDEDLRLFLRERKFRFAFVQDETMFARVEDAAPADVHSTIICMEPTSAVLDIDEFMKGVPVAELDEFLESRIRGIHEDAAAAVIRTSGTTGVPKLVRLSHGNFLYNMRALPPRVNLDSRDCVLSCLPAWHLYARIVEYTALGVGARIVYCRIDELAAALPRYRPTVLPGFPEIWERAFHGIVAEMDARRGVGFFFQALLFASRRLYAAREKFRGRGWRPKAYRWWEVLVRVFALFESVFYFTPHFLGELIFYRGIRDIFGGRLSAAIIGDAPLPPFIDESLRAIGFKVLEGYGSTEQNVSALRDISNNAVGTAGRPLAGSKFLILDDSGEKLPPGEIGRIAVAGPGVFDSYDREAHTAPEFLERDGHRFYLTGDLGILDANGYLKLVGREKNVFRLAGGALVRPERIENVLRGSKFVERVLVIGKEQAFVTALITPDRGELLAHLRGRRRKFRHGSEPLRGRDEEYIRRVLRLPAVRRLYEKEIHRVTGNSELAVTEMPFRIALIAKPFLPGRELTPTLKLRRRFIEQEYEQEIRALYAVERFEPPHWNGPRELPVRAWMWWDRRLRK